MNAQKLMGQKQALFESLRTFDIKYPKGLGEAHRDTMRNMEANYPEEDREKQRKLLDAVQFLQKELNDDQQGEPFLSKDEKELITTMQELNSTGKIQEIICDTKPEDIKIDKVYFDKMMQKPEEVKEEVKPKKKKNKK